tara:strand:+ start:1225 stop:1464 length:240 start_codon:yes stop_codon:yes gene_type:complete
MDTNLSIIKVKSNEIKKESILESGNYFSGVLYHDLDEKSWVAFNLVNKEKMIYILEEVDFKKGVKIEIFSYVVYPKELQ